MTNLSEERARIVQISQHLGAKLFPKMTDVLCDSGYSAEVCGCWLDAAMADRDAALRAAGSAAALPAHRQTSQQPQSGLGTPSSTEDRPGRQNVAGSWPRAIATANRAVDSIVGGSERTSPGWGKAVSNANR